MKSSLRHPLLDRDLNPGRLKIAPEARSLRRARIPVIPSAFTAKKVMPCCDKVLVKRIVLYQLSYGFLTEADGTRTRDIEINGL